MRLLLVLGDSLALGFCATDRHGWPERVAEKTGSELVVFAKGGFTSRLALNWYWPVRTPLPDLIVIGLGMNDMTLGRWRKPLVPPAEYASNISRIAASLQTRSPAAPIVAIAPPPAMPGWKRAGEPAPYARALRAAGLTVADPAASWNGHVDYPEPNHPGDEGHELIAQAVIAALPHGVNSSAPQS